MASETPADTIRRAAALMRQRAEAASYGPWAAEEYHHSGYLVARNITSQAAGGVGSAESAADAEHIASWHPLVALAVAELLADIANGEDLEFIERSAEAAARAWLVPTPEVTL